MVTKKTPLISKLLLMALVLILGCLLVIIVQLKSRNRDQQASAVTVTSEATFETLRAVEIPEQRNPPQSPPVRATRKVVNPAPPELESGTADPHPVSQTKIEAAGIAALRPERVTTINNGVFVTQLPLSRGIRGRTEINGIVFLDGTPPREIPITTDGTVCGRLENQPLTTRHYVVPQDGRRARALANVFVYVKEGLENLRFPNSTNQPVLDNIGCQFEPYVMGLQVGQALRLKNSDPIMHDVHANSRLNSEFNVALVRKDDVNETSFSVPEIFVRVKCDVHPWMFAYIGVLPHPFFAVTDSEGRFRLPPGLPPANTSSRLTTSKQENLWSKSTSGRIRKRSYLSR